MALFVIGAGATRGCSFVKSENHSCIPPLDRDFFTQLQRVQNPKYFPLIEDVLTDTIRLFGQNFNATLESTFTAIEHIGTMIESTGIEGEFKKKEIIEIRKRLMQAIFAVMEDSLSTPNADGSSSLIPNNCVYHEKLVKEILKRKDDILSFNYDCVLDYALKKFGDHKWNAENGYVINKNQNSKNFVGHEKWQPAIPSTASDSVRYHKLHGSLNFSLVKAGKANEASDKVKLKVRPYTKQNGNVKFEIIPPEWNKKYSRGFFKNIWSSSSLAINNAEHLIIIGYSMPLTDSHSVALFNTSIKRGSLKSLVIVNPDQDTRRRIRSILHRGLSEKTKILSFNTLSEFISCKRNVWDI